jgi:hypothetical protein
MVKLTLLREFYNTGWAISRLTEIFEISKHFSQATYGPPCTWQYILRLFFVYCLRHQPTVISATVETSDTKLSSSTQASTSTNEVRCRERTTPWHI